MGNILQALAIYVQLRLSNNNRIGGDPSKHHTGSEDSHTSDCRTLKEEACIRSSHNGAQKETCKWTPGGCVSSEDTLPGNANHLIQTPGGDIYGLYGSPGLGRENFCASCQF
jgi:hypothetical protein